MQNFLSKNRWVILAAGAVIQIFTGIPAAWGVFQQPIIDEFSMSDGSACILFALTVAFFGIGCLVGGFVQDRKGPRVAGVAGTIGLAGGFCLSSLVRGSGWWLALTFSVPVGMGSAFLYPAVMSCAQKWYADKKGVATGVIGGAVGLSGAVLTLSGRAMQRWWGLRGCFLGFGILMAVFCGTACILLQNPAQQAKKKQKTNLDKSPRQMLKTKNYWLLLSVTALGTPAVLLFSPIILKMAVERGLPDAAAPLCIIIGSVGSAAGRLAMPALSDKLGRKWVDMGLFAALAVLSAAFVFAQGWWVIAGYTALTFCYSGECALLPAFSTDLFGMKHAGINYGFLALGQSVGSVTFALTANLSGGLLLRHIIGGAAAAAGCLLLWMITPPQKKKN